MSRLLLFTLLACLGCDDKRPKPEPPATAEFVIEQDGVKLWRVKDKWGRVCFMTTPTGDVQWTTTNGKQTTTNESKGVAKP